MRQRFKLGAVLAALSLLSCGADDRVAPEEARILAEYLTPKTRRVE